MSDGHVENGSAERPVYARLDELGITYTRYGHPPIASAEAGEQYWSGIDAAHCKNLFMRNQKGTTHYLVILQDQKHLGLEPGSVSPFGLIHDADHAVRVAIDRDLKSAARISFHPNINTATIVLAVADFQRFLEASGNPVQYVTVGSGDRG
jgi:Ala-tRNA(Pro) deacylase